MISTTSLYQTYILLLKSARPALCCWNLETVSVSDSILYLSTLQEYNSIEKYLSLKYHYQSYHWLNLALRRHVNFARDIYKWNILYFGLLARSIWLRHYESHKDSMLQILSLFQLNIMQSCTTAAVSASYFDPHLTTFIDWNHLKEM